MKIKMWDSPVASILLMVLLLLTVAIVLASSTLPVSAQVGIQPDQWVSGTTTLRARTNQYSFYGSAGQYVTVRMERDNGSKIDPWLDLKDTYGYVVVSDDDSAGGGNSQINGYYLQSTGWYTIVARSYNNQSYGRYWLYYTVNW